MIVFFKRICNVINKIKNSINLTYILQITNILCSLELNTSYHGNKLTNKIIRYDIELITILNYAKNMDPY